MDPEFFWLPQRWRQSRFDKRRPTSVRSGERRHTAMIAQTEAWDAPAPLAGVKRFMLEQLRESRSFDASPFDLPKPPPPVAEWRAKRMERLQSWHADKLEEVAKQTQAKKEGDEFRATLIQELQRLRA